MKTETHQNSQEDYINAIVVRYSVKELQDRRYNFSYKLNQNSIRNLSGDKITSVQAAMDVIRHRVIAAGVPRMASQDALYGKPDPGKKTELPYSLECIFTAGRMKTAYRWYKPGYCQLVNTYQYQDSPAHHSLHPAT